MQPVRFLLVSLLFAACAPRITSRSSEELNRSPRYCGDAVYAVQTGQDDDAAARGMEALAEVALSEPEAFRCNPNSPGDAQHNLQHIQDTGGLQPNR